MLSDPRHDLNVVTVLAEACVAFSADPDEPAVCSGCGWLDLDHQAAEETASAEVSRAA